MNKLEIEVKKINEDGWRRESICDTENGIKFSVQNLDDCPEDAIIGRSLFDSYDYIKALNKGIELAGRGYTEIIGKYVEVSSDNE